MTTAALRRDPDRASPWVDAGGPVHLATFGGDPEAPAVVCVHGLGSSHAAWQPLAQVLVEAFRVHAVDLPGNGRTPALGRSADVREQGIVLSRVLERLGQPVTLVGHSMGAAVATMVAADRPDLVSRLLLVAPPLPRHGLAPCRASLAPYVALCLMPSSWRRSVRRLLGAGEAEDVVRRTLRLTCASPEALADLVPLLAEEVRTAQAHGHDGWESFVDAARSVGTLVLAGEEYRQTLSRIRVPTRVVHGELDRVLSPGALGQLDDLQPDWETFVLPGVGHSPHLEAPGRTAALLASWPTVATDSSAG